MLRPQGRTSARNNVLSKVIFTARSSGGKAGGKDAGGGKVNGICAGGGKAAGDGKAGGKAAGGGTALAAKMTVAARLVAKLPGGGKVWRQSLAAWRQSWDREPPVAD